MISNCGPFHLTSLKEVKYIEFDACDVRNVITKINPQYMILVTGFYAPSFLAIFANYFPPPFLQSSIKGMFLLSAHSVD